MVASKVSEQHFAGTSLSIYVVITQRTKWARVTVNAGLYGLPSPAENSTGTTRGEPLPFAPQDVSLKATLGADGFSLL